MLYISLLPLVDFGNYIILVTQARVNSASGDSLSHKARQCDSLAIAFCTALNTPVWLRKPREPILASMWMAR